MARGGAVAIVVAVLVAAGGQASIAGTASQPACAGVSAGAQARLMRAYSNAGSYPATQVNSSDGVPRSVAVEIPRIRFTGAGRSSTLPVGPCQTIYRYRYPSVHVEGPGSHEPSPFKYVEIDWNTEGRPRGPNGSFKSAHFDFHFYVRTKREVDDTTMCVSTNGRVCDPLRTPYEQMRRFLTLPPAQFIPTRYQPDVGSSIPMMGLHLLDMTFHYSFERVNHYPTLIYGTFDGRVLFAEASVTQDTLQDAVASRTHTISFPFRQPRAVRGNVPWPTSFVIRYLPKTGGFTAGFEGFRAR